jgi:hypothetical protein
MPVSASDPPIARFHLPPIIHIAQLSLYLLGGNLKCNTGGRKY